MTDTHLKPESKDDKLGIVDVKVKTKSGEQKEPWQAVGRNCRSYQP
jgi:hypothetical protein